MLHHATRYVFGNFGGAITRVKFYGFLRIIILHLFMKI